MGRRAVGRWRPSSSCGTAAQRLGARASSALRDRLALRLHCISLADWRMMTLCGREKHSLRTLRMPRSTFGDQLHSMGVTPQMLSTDVVAQLAHYIESQLVHQQTCSGGWTAPTATWRAFLLREQYESIACRERGGAYTEYELYWAFAQHMRQWDRYHTHAYLQNANASVWLANEFSSWDPCPEPVELRYKFWAVVQSQQGISADQVWERLRSC